MAIQIFKQLFLPIGMVLTLGLLACDSELGRSDLQNGDILFTGPTMATTGDLSKAIDEVTQTQLATNYTHMGIVEKDKQQLWVIHAAPKKGVCREPLNQFLESRAKAAVYRLNKPYQAFIPEALDSARQLLGMPYDSSYIIGGEAHYCSGLLYTIFEPHLVFELEPMTFKNPATGEFHAIWVEHYAALGMAIPEGLPGCNPNGLSASGHLQYVGMISY
jgi:predicted transcriptional regulator